MILHYREEMAVTLCGRAAVRLAMTRIPDAQRDCEAALEPSWLVDRGTDAQGCPGESRVSQPCLARSLALQSRIQFLQGRAPEGRQTHAEAVEKLSRAIQLDPARAADKVRLEQIKCRPGSVGRVKHQDVTMMIPLAGAIRMRAPGALLGMTRAPWPCTTAVPRG